MLWRAGSTPENRLDGHTVNNYPLELEKRVVYFHVLLAKTGNNNAL